jgi:hypothetical protein
MWENPTDPQPFETRYVSLISLCRTIRLRLCLHGSAQEVPYGTGTVTVVKLQWWFALTISKITPSTCCSSGHVLLARGSTLLLRS